MSCETLLATEADLKLHLDFKGGTENDELFELLLAAVSDEFEEDTRRKLLRATYTAERYRVAAFIQTDLALRQYPVDPDFTMTVVEGATTLTAAQFRLEGTDPHAPSRLVRLTNARPSVWQQSDVTITYRAGWDPVPRSVRLAVVEHAAHRYNQTSRSGRSQLGLASKTPDGAATESYVDELLYWKAAVGRFQRRF